MIVAEIFPLHHAAGSQTFLLHFAAWSQISTLYYAAGSQISLLHFSAGSQIFRQHYAAGSQILPLHDAAKVKSYHRMMQRESIWQRGVKSKNSGRLPRPLKGQSCRKNHIWGTFNILVL
jgi:hypothetical protein